MKSQLREVFSLIQYGPIDAEKCLVHYFDRVSKQVYSIPFNEFIKLKNEFGVPDHRIRAVVTIKDGIEQILFQRSEYNFSQAEQLREKSPEEK